MRTRKMLQNKTTWILAIVFLLWLTIYAVNRRRGYKELESDLEHYSDAFNYDSEEELKDGKSHRSRRDQVKQGDEDLPGYTYDTDEDDDDGLPKVEKEEEGLLEEERTGDEAEPRDESNILPPGGAGASNVGTTEGSVVTPVPAQDEGVAGGLGSEESLEGVEGGDDDLEMPEGDDDMDEMVSQGNDDEEGGDEDLQGGDGEQGSEGISEGGQQSMVGGSPGMIGGSPGMAGGMMGAGGQQGMMGAGGQQGMMGAGGQQGMMGSPYAQPPQPGVIPAVQYDGRYEVPNKEIFINISGNRDFEMKLDTLSTAPIPYLPNYKNPCWFEQVTDGGSYFDNFFVLATDRNMRFMETYKKMQTLIQQRADNPSEGPGVGWRLRCLPYFYIPGVAKCGSTDLMMALTMHPDIIKGDMKELKYWNRIRHPHWIKRYQRAIEEHPVLGTFPRSINHFLEALDDSAERVRINFKQPQRTGDPPYHQRIIGDGTPSYMWDFDSWMYMDLNKGLSEPRYIAAHYIRHVTPDAKMIFIMRNPVDRLYSDYKGFQKQQKKSRQYFHDRAERGIRAFEECQSARSFRACLYDYDTNNREDVLPVRIRVGIYQPFLKDWMDVFPRNQVFIIQLEEYSTKREQILNELFDFLGVGPMPQEKFDILNKVGVRNAAARRMDERVGGKMYDNTREMLTNFYRPHNEALAQYLGDDKWLWL